METILFFLSCLVGSCCAQLHGKQQLLVDVTPPARVSTLMGLQLLTHQRATGHGPAGSRQLIKTGTNNCYPKFMEIHCPGCAGGSEVTVLVCDVIPMSTPCFSHLQLDQECNLPKMRAAFPPVCGAYSAPVLHSLLKSMHSNAKSKHSDLQGLCCAVFYQEEAGADPDLLQHLVLLSQGGLAWAEQQQGNQKLWY